MSQEDNFQELLTRAAHGDLEAEAILYEEFLPAIERFIRFRLRDLNVLWAVDPPDVYDSVWRTIRHSKSLESIKDAMQFSRYLEGAVRKKTLLIRRQLTAGRRDFRRADSSQVDAAIDADHDPAKLAESADLFSKASLQLSTEELAICALFCDGHSWTDIGSRLGMSADAARMIRSRAEERVRRWLVQPGTQQERS